MFNAFKEWVSRPVRISDALAIVVGLAVAAGVGLIVGYALASIS